MTAALEPRTAAHGASPLMRRHARNASRHLCALRGTRAPRTRHALAPRPQLRSTGLWPITDARVRNLSKLRDSLWEPSRGSLQQAQTHERLGAMLAFIPVVKYFINATGDFILALVFTNHQMMPYRQSLTTSIGLVAWTDGRQDYVQPDGKPLFGNGAASRHTRIRSVAKPLKPSHKNDSPRRPLRAPAAGAKKPLRAIPLPVRR